MKCVRTTAYYRWRSAVKCTNNECRLWMFGGTYGNNGLTTLKEMSFDGEDEAFADLIKRWNHDNDAL